MLPVTLPFAGDTGFSAWNTQALAPFPQAFTTHAQFSRQFGFRHVVLMLKHKVLEVVFQRKVFSRVMAGVTATDALLWAQADKVVVLQIAQLDVDAQQFG